jgi:NADH:ubiquinone oxidoreductase subunit D
MIALDRPESNLFPNTVRDHQGLLTINVTSREALKTLEILKSNLGFSYASLIANDHDKGCFLVQLRNLKSLDTINLQVDAKFDDNFFEKILFTKKELGIYTDQELSSVDEIRKSLKSNPNLSEKPYPHELEQWFYFPFDHQIPHGVGDLLVSVQAGKIRRSYWHLLGNELFRSRLSRKNIWAGLNSESRLFDFTQETSCIAWAFLVEEIFQQPAPEKAQAIRLIFLELNRVENHLRLLSSVAKDEGYPRSWAELTKALAVLFSLKRDYFSSGTQHPFRQFFGVNESLTQSWIQQAFLLLKKIFWAVKFWEDEMALNSIARRNLRRGQLSGHQALGVSLSGPNLRASGMYYDVRKAFPYSFYKDLEFDVPVGRFGDNFDRCLVRMEEIYQSLKIIEQLLENMPTGPVALFETSQSVQSVRDFMSGKWSSLRISLQSRFSFTLEGPRGEFVTLVHLAEEKEKVHSTFYNTNMMESLAASQLALREQDFSALGTTLKTFDFSPSSIEEKGRLT